MANELFSTFEKERMDSKTERGETLVSLNMNVCERKNFDPIESDGMITKFGKGK